ncbi:MAG: DUF4417 domain-containing protein [Planctomycetia bacterium]|nr:DUF4417 domain-containing protein [Planctomycetia bacterium]
MNLDCIDFVAITGSFGIPEVLPESVVPESLISFNQVKSFRKTKTGVGVHFFIDDYQFERTWNRPERYLEILKEFKCVMMPDFSMFVEMPRAMQIWNHYRKMAVAQFWQKNGVRIIPTLNWSSPKSFDFCFDGMPERGTVAVSSIGCCKRKGTRERWIRGMNEAVGRLKPKTILFYGSPIEFQNQGSEVVYFQPEHLQRVRKIRKGKIEVGERTKWLMENPGVIGAVAKNLGIQYDDWEDLRQEVMLQSLRCKDGFEKSKAGIQTWAWNFVRMVARKFQKNVMQKNSREVLWDDVRNALKNKD